LDKEKGLTSNKALQQIKHLFEAEKAGHTGSLDPLATGVLPICFGQATKFSRFLLDAEKTYEVTIVLGVTTESGDTEARVVQRRPTNKLNRDRVESILKKYLGRTQQIPSMFSALKVNGERLYKLARKGIKVDRDPRHIEVYELNLLSLDGNEAKLFVRCSKGTYVRTLVEDIGESLGCGAHVRELRRLRVASLSIKDCFTFESILAFRKKNELLDAKLLPIDSALSGWPKIFVPENSLTSLRHGKTISVEGLAPLGFVTIYSKKSKPPDDFLGLGESLANGRLAPKKMLVN
ncbi:MAG: tRNA pseudouridine(55) synthase TruB, partial [Pseudomonadota bacterium]|nr:tRNA pseudouridine(55) synthase TruB [Pseudomonadota bacterium]